MNILFSMFFFKFDSFIFFMFRSTTHLSWFLYKVWSLDQGFVKFLCMHIQLFQDCLLNCLFTFVKNQLAVIMCVYIWTFSSAPLMYYQYHTDLIDNFCVVSLKIDYRESLHGSLLFQNSFDSFLPVFQYKC